MEKNFISISISYIPIVAISFVSFLLIYKVYTLIRSKFKIFVNCWFCNHNIKVPYDLRNSWHCPNCDQYNGFKEDGDYNCEIQAQLNCNPPIVQYARSKGSPKKNTSGNGLCETCNENQRIIIEKLAQFEPKSEHSFEKEFKNYKSILEHRHRLCVTCERHVCKILRDKKKIILGSKLAAFILQSVNSLKTAPLLKHVKRSRKLFLRNLNSLCLLCLAVINFVIIINELTETRARNGLVKEDSLTSFAYVAMSHLIAFGKVIANYLQHIWKIEIIEKSYLFIKTLLVLCYYTLGFRFSKSTIVNVSFINPLNVSFGSIFLAFINNILDGFKLGKSALLLTAWSLYAGIANNPTVDFYGMDVLKVATSIAAIVLSFPSFKRSNKELLDTTTNSFHRIYSEDYLNDGTNENSNLFNSTLRNNISNKSNSLNSSGSSIKSFTSTATSPRFLSPTSRKIDMNSSVFKPSSPISNFKSLSPGNVTLSNHNINHGLQNSFVDSNMYSHNNITNNNWCRPAPFTTYSQQQQPIQHNNCEYSVRQKINNNHHPMHSIFDNSRKNHFSTVSPSSPQNITFPVNNSVCRQNIVSPSRLGIQAYAMQSSWVSGGYFNNPNVYGQKNYFLDSAGPKETVSRASSQSSGFESLQNGEQLYSRENSYCPDDFYAPQCGDMHFNKLNNNGRSLESPIGLLPQYQVEKPFNSFNLNHQSNSPPPPPACCSPALSCQSYSSNYFTDHTFFNNPANIARSTSSSPFDLNKMGEDLPSIQRGSLLKNWKDQNIIN